MKAVKSIQGLLVGLSVFCAWKNWGGVVPLLMMYFASLIVEENL